MTKPRKQEASTRECKGCSPHKIKKVHFQNEPKKDEGPCLFLNGSSKTQGIVCFPPFEQNRGLDSLSLDPQPPQFLTRRIHIF